MKKMIVVLVLGFTQAWAQQEVKGRKVELEIDPIAYALKGYSFHGIFAPQRWRFDLGIYGIQQPEFFHGNKGFDVYTYGVGTKAMYVLKGLQGFYVGLGSGYSVTEATQQSTGIKKQEHTMDFGPLIGYRFFLMKDKEGNPKGLYISPWVSVGYNYHFDRIEFEGVDYKSSDWTVFPTIHIGYRF